ncbi:phosphomevalonate kinase [Streptomyces kunmingensis]|uniref:phosphomevalonate kinase n=1 Tax=Streptomyces kunmingensis TaxID=68225 RepID=A0ABU6CAX0_9ACTN|nr:phosphomevalonate kinase [Streptomyces kunmingensis]MEB3961216.1 phosphomevalonate kinase [Streptomyces kunmingensis]
MTGGPTAVRHAPGKLFVAGEYAVVEPGVPAIVAAVDRSVTVTVDARDDDGVVISSDLVTRPMRLRRRDAALEVCPGQDEKQVRGASAHVVSAVETVAALLTERGLPVPGLDITVSSRLHDSGTKFGLGSSGAVTVASVAAVAAHCGLELSRADRFRLALLASARLDPSGSGGDLAAATWGGWVAYRAPDRAQVLALARRHGVGRALRAPWPGLEVREVPPPRGLRLEVGWTGRPASTTSLVAGLHRREWRASASYRAFIETSTEIVGAATDALDNGDDRALTRQIRRARTELARLDTEARLGIFTPELTALCEAAEAVGGAAKPSGAGGGDCGIALLDATDTRAVAQVHERWTAAGVRPLSVGPTPERNQG